jgi:hypothetical protein
MAEVDRRKAELIAELEVSRGEMRSSMRRVEHSADVLQRIRSNVGQNLGYWITGGLASGFLLARLLLPLLFPRTPHAAEEPRRDEEPDGPDTEKVPASRKSAARRAAPLADGGEPWAKAPPSPSASPSASSSVLVAGAKIAFELAKPKLMELAGAWLNRQLSRQLGSLLETENSGETVPASSPPSRGQSRVPEKAEPTIQNGVHIKG